MVCQDDLHGRGGHQRIGRTNQRKFTTFKQSDVIGVVCAVVEEMKHQMEDGKTVALGDLGRFKYSIQSDLVDSPNVFNPNKHIKKVVCKFTPKGVRDQLTKKMIYPMLENLKFHVMK
jgi:predicted histone-like DNA-binding protein